MTHSFNPHTIGNACNTWSMNNFSQWPNKVILIKDYIIWCINISKHNKEIILLKPVLQCFWMLHCNLDKYMTPESVESSKYDYWNADNHEIIS